MKLSIIIPVYNVKPWLRGCLDSVVKSLQGLDEAEVICVDDGSTDGSSDILDEYLRHQSFRILHQGNSGVSAARNCGLDVAQGEWVAFVDADDCVAPEWFSVLLKTAESHPEADVVRSWNVVSIWSDEEMRTALIRKTPRKWSARTYVGHAARDWGYKRYVRQGWSMLNMVRRNFIGRTRFRDGMRINEDTVFFLELSEHLVHVVEVDYTGYFYRRRDGSALRSYRRVEDSVCFFETMIGFNNRFYASRALGYDLVQWMEERDWSQGYNGATCPLRNAWRKAIENGQLDMRGIRWWWRPGIRQWLKTGSLNRLRVIKKKRVQLGCFIVSAGKAMFGKRWTKEYI